MIYSKHRECARHSIVEKKHTCSPAQKATAWFLKCHQPIFNVVIIEIPHGEMATRPSVVSSCAGLKSATRLNRYASKICLT